MSINGTEEKTPAQKILTTPASAMFNALLDFCLDNPDPRTTPQVTQLAITSDGFLMAWNTNSPLKEGLVGDAEDFDHNVRGICKHCGLTIEETQGILTSCYAKITDWRPESTRTGCKPSRN